MKNAFGIILILYLKIWKYNGLFIAYKSIVNGKSRKSSRRDKNAYSCLPSHLGSWIQKGLLPIRFHIRMENFLTKNISFKLKLVYKNQYFQNRRAGTFKVGFPQNQNFSSRKSQIFVFHRFYLIDFKKSIILHGS